MATITKENLFQQALASSVRISTNSDKGLINKNSGSSVIMKEDGTYNTSSGIYAQYKQNPETGTATEMSLHSNTITVQKDLIANDISINYHKLNSQLYELTNMKEVMNTSIGNLTMAGTVLVKTYEPTLKKWVLMRRQVRLPIFSNLLDAYALDETLGLDLGNTYDNISDYKINKNNYK